ncbi:MAG: hypothetical protein ACOCV1_06870 [Bacillota bacterium]
MKKSSKIIITIGILLILIRIFNPVKTITTPTLVTVEYDPLFDELSSNRDMREAQLYAKEVGETSITNLYHSIYVAIILSAIVLLIEKNKAKNKSKSS